MYLALSVNRFSWVFAFLFGIPIVLFSCIVLLSSSVSFFDGAIFCLALPFPLLGLFGRIVFRVFRPCSLAHHSPPSRHLGIL